MVKFSSLCLLFSLAFSQIAYSRHNKNHHKVVKQPKTKIEQYVADTEKEYGLPRCLLTAVIAHESSFEEKAINNTTYIPSYGLGQITLPTARDFCNIKTKRELFHREKNVHCTAKILRHHIRMYGSVHSALAAYRAGTPCSKRRHSRTQRMCTRSDEIYISAVERKKEALSYR